MKQHKKTGENPELFITTIKGKQLRHLFRMLTFTSFKDNKIPPGARLMKGPVIELRLRGVMAFDKAKEEVESMIKTTKQMLENQKVRDYIVTPSYIIHPDGNESFLLTVAITAPMIELHQSIPHGIPDPTKKDPLKEGPKPGGGLIITG